MILEKNVQIPQFIEKLFQSEDGRDRMKPVWSKIKSGKKFYNKSLKHFCHFRTGFLHSLEIK